MTYQVISKNICRVCSNVIVVQIRMATGICGETCAKLEYITLEREASESRNEEG